MINRRTQVVLVFLLASCATEPIADVARELAAADVDVIADAGRCYVDPCFLCPPPHGLCFTTGCIAPDPDGNVCYEAQRAPGESCASGVGLCNAAGACVVPGGRCAPGPVGQWSHGCRAHIDCDDGNPCTQDECGNILGLGWCSHVRIIDGTGCGLGMSCTSGLCCEPPAP